MDQFYYQFYHQFYPVLSSSIQRCQPPPAPRRGGGRGAATARSGSQGARGFPNGSGDLSRARAGPLFQATSTCRVADVLKCRLATCRPAGRLPYQGHKKRPNPGLLVRGMKTSWGLAVARLQPCNKTARPVRRRETTCSPGAPAAAASFTPISVPAANLVCARMNRGGCFTDSGIWFADPGRWETRFWI